MLKNKITQDTLMPLTLIGTLLYVVFQVGGSYSQIQGNTKKISTIEIDSKEYLKTLKMIDSRLIKMETSIELLSK